MGRGKSGLFLPLSPIDRDAEDSPLFAFDVETLTDKRSANHENWYPSPFRFGSLYDGETYHDFWDRREMAEFMCDPRWDGWIGFAAFCEYDLNAIFKEPTWPVRRNFFQGTFKSAEIDLGKGRRKTRSRKRRGPRCRIFDTMQHCKASVEKLGGMLGLPKLEMPDMAHATRQEIVQYCRRDTKIVFDVMNQRKRSYLDEGAKMGSSSASVSMDLFRRRFMDERHAFKKLTPELLENFRLSYHGARTESYVHGWKGIDHGDGKGVTFGDVNGMYVWAMRDTRVPILHKPRGTRNPSEAARMIDRDVEGVARVEVEVPDDMYYPPLPARIKNSKLYFPTGRFEGVYPLNEIRHALSCGVKVRKVRWVIYYHEHGRLFQDFAVYVYDQRQAASSPILNRTFKDIGNSLYGKWAMGGDALVIGPNWWAPPNGRKYGKEGQYVQETEVGTIAAYTNYIWSSYITAAARIRIHEGLVNHHGMYTDTDSVATFDDIGESKDLGAMSFDGWSRNVEFVAPKTYLCENEEGTVKVRTKGIPSSALGIRTLRTLQGHTIAEVVPYKEMDRLCMEYVFQRAMRFREGVVRGIEPNSWGMVYKMIRLQERDRKRVHLPNGETRPLDAAEIREREGDFEAALDAPWYDLAHNPLRVPAVTLREKEARVGKTA